MRPEWLTPEVLADIEKMQISQMIAFAELPSNLPTLVLSALIIGFQMGLEHAKKQNEINELTRMESLPTPPAP